MSYPNAALTYVCKELLDEWGLTLDDISNLAHDIPGECASLISHNVKREIVSADYDAIAPNQHRLIVKSWDEERNRHECTLEGTDNRVRVDLLSCGSLPGDVKPESLIGRVVEVEYTHGYTWLAEGTKVAPQTPIAAQGGE